MNKIIKGLAGITLIAGSLCADKKTELILRDPATYASAFTTYHQLGVKANNNFATKFEITGFYNQTQSDEDLGNHFGANGTNQIKVGNKAAVDASTADVYNSLLLHYASAPTSNLLAGTLSFEPERTSWGTRFDTFVKMDKLLKGLYFRANFAIMEVENDLHMKVASSVPGVTGAETITLQDILAGKSVLHTVAPQNANEQARLHFAKIDGSHSRTGISNMDFFLGWRFLEKKNYFVGLNILLQTPSGDRPTGEFLWEPRLGSKHWALGGSLEAAVNLWSDKDQTIKLFMDVNYRYQFEEDEHRTLGLKSTYTAAPYNAGNYAKYIMSHYYLLGENGHYAPLIPAANVLTRNVEVEPGSMIDGIIGFNYNNGGFTFDLGYNLFWKEAESVSLKDWHDDGKYGIYAPTLATCTAAFDPTSGSQSLGVINAANIDTGVAETPSMITHSIFGGLGYIWKTWEHPLMLGLGGAYEFGGDHDAGDSFTLYLKAGVAF